MAVVTKTHNAKFIGECRGFFRIDTESDNPNCFNFSARLREYGLEPLSAKETLPMLLGNLRNMAMLLSSEKEKDTSFYLKNTDTFFEEGYGKRVITINKKGEMKLHGYDSKIAKLTLDRLEPTRRMNRVIWINPGNWTPILTVLGSNRAVQSGYRFLLSGDYHIEGANTLVGSPRNNNFGPILERVIRN